MEEMEAVGLLEGFSGGWSLHETKPSGLLARPEIRIRVPIFPFDPLFLYPRLQGGFPRIHVDTFDARKTSGRLSNCQTGRMRPLLSI